MIKRAEENVMDDILGHDNTTIQLAFTWVGFLGGLNCPLDE